MQVANTRAVHGVSLAPNNKSLVSYVDNVVTLWDIRMFEKSTSQFQMSKDVTSVAWSPTRSSVISVLQRESPLVSVIELHWNSNALESDAEPHFIKRTISPYELMNKGDQHSLQFNSLDYLSWHPKQTERVILLSNSNLLCDFKIPERVSISFDNNNKLWSSVGNMIKDLTVNTPVRQKKLLKISSFFPYALFILNKIFLKNFCGIFYVGNMSNMSYVVNIYLIVRFFIPGHNTY